MLYACTCCAPAHEGWCLHVVSMKTGKLWIREWVALHVQVRSLLCDKDLRSKSFKSTISTTAAITVPAYIGVRGGAAAQGACLHFSVIRQSVGFLGGMNRKKRLNPGRYRTWYVLMHHGQSCHARKTPLISGLRLLVHVYGWIRHPERKKSPFTTSIFHNPSGSE